ncbi:hypothetical protein G7046_g3947 [Stylonectria norvegica]|nr:hypothetical protein G7046_g3947 [Stylonectria norvegica]
MATSSSSRSGSHVSVEAIAVVEWSIDGETHCLASPDPATKDIILSGEIAQQDQGAPAVSFKLQIPVNIKGIPFKTHLVVIIDPESIVSLDLKKSIEVTPLSVLVRERFKDFTLLRFTVSRSVDIVALDSSLSPQGMLIPARPASGLVFDQLRSLSKARDISIYISNQALPKASARSIYKAAASSLAFRSFDPQSHLETLYESPGGSRSAGRVISISALGNSKLPTYEEASRSQGSLAPNLEKEPLEQYLRLIEAEMVTLSNARLECNMRMVEFVKDTVRGVKERQAILDLKQKELSEEIDSLHEKAAAADGFAEKIDVDFRDADDDYRNLEMRVDYIADNGMDEQTQESIVQQVFKQVLDHLESKGLDEHIENKIADAVFKRVIRRIGEKGLGSQTNDKIAAIVLEKLHSAIGAAASKE